MSGRCLSLSFCSFPFLTYPSPVLSLSLTLILSLHVVLCQRSALTRGTLMKSFQGRIWRSEMSFSDQMSLKQCLSYHLVRSTSLALCTVSRQLSQTQSLNEITCGFLVFLPLMFYKENYTPRWKESSAILKVHRGISFTLTSVCQISRSTSMKKTHFELTMPLLSQSIPECTLFNFLLLHTPYSTVISAGLGALAEISAATAISYACGWQWLWSRLNYLNNYWLGRHENWYRHPCSPED